MLACLDLECAGRRPSGFDVGKVESVELRPQNIAFVAQGLDCQLLLGARLGVIEYVVESELRIFRRLIKSGFEIVEASGEPGIKLTQFFHSKSDELGREQFRQRRGDGFQQRTAANDIEIFIDRETSGGKNAFSGADLRRV